MIDKIAQKTVGSVKINTKGITVSANTDKREHDNDLGSRPLFQLLLRGLPTYQKARQSGEMRLKIREIAREIEVTPQAIYKRFEPGADQNTIKITMARKLVDLSEREVAKEGVPDDFEPLTIEDFHPYLT
jgi:hypothetical protein